ncbi:hypothetical protein N7522_006419 [Penicillium canescens]|nr:hypothetical protein N7522_006419 [Penicillium canescens]
MSFRLSITASLLAQLGVVARSTIDSGNGFVTYYYDVEQVNTCGTTFESQNQGGVMCSSLIPLSLNQINTNHLVAMNSTQLRQDPAKYCGKQVIVSVSGKPSTMQLFIGDGCERCSVGSSSARIWNAEGAPGLDFSYTVLDELAGGNACSLGHLAISWEITDTTINDIVNSSSGVPLPSVSKQPGYTTASASPQCSAPLLVPSRVQIGANTTISSATACTDNVWKRDGNVLEQCIGTTWTPRETCFAGWRCRGGSNPYCTPGYVGKGVMLL